MSHDADLSPLMPDADGASPLILVAGGSGRLGRLVANRLLTEGLRVRVLTRNPSATTDLTSPRLDPRIELVPGDVQDPASLSPAMSGVSTVISAVHGLVGSGGSTPATVDRDGNRNLVDAAGSESATVILVSTIDASPGHPMELFRMKWAAEEHLRASGLPWTILRCSAFAETWIDLLRQTAGRSGRPQVFGRGDNPINFVRVSDVAAAVVRATQDVALRGHVIDVGGPENLTLNQLARLVQASMAKSTDAIPAGPKPLRHVPRPAMRAMGTIARPFNPTMARLARAAVVMDTCDLTFDPEVSTRAYPWLSHSPVEEHGVLVPH